MSNYFGLWITFLFLTANATDLIGKEAAAQRKNFSHPKEWLGVPHTKIIYLVYHLIKAADGMD